MSEKYVVRREQIESMEGLAKTHFLNPQAKRINKSLGDIVGLTGLGVHVIELPPGSESTEYHVHYMEDECVYVLDGDAIVTIDGEDYPVSAGDFIGYPAGQGAHTMINTGENVLRCLVIGQRLAYDVADYPRLGKRIFRYDGENDLVNLADVTKPTMGRKV